MSMQEKGVLLESSPIEGKGRQQAWIEGEVRLYAVSKKVLVNPTWVFKSEITLVNIKAVMKKPGYYASVSAHHWMWTAPGR